MPATKNPCAKTRPVNNPYEVWVAPGWEWRVLKKWASPEKERGDRYARWFCAVQGPGTFDGYDMGDTYVADVTQYATRIPDDKLAAYLAANPWRQY